MGPDAASIRGKDSWYFLVDIANDLQDVDLPLEVKAEVLGCFMGVYSMRGTAIHQLGALYCLHAYHGSMHRRRL